MSKTIDHLCDVPLTEKQINWFKGKQAYLERSHKGVEDLGVISGWRYNKIYTKTVDCPSCKIQVYGSNHS